jgi:hypothetical protein
MDSRLSVLLFDVKICHKYSCWFETPQNKAALDIQLLVGPV